jgi:ribonuclease BN (tRNA processing enzyme)
VKVTVLGCAGTFPRADSACSAYLVEHDGFTVLLDMGNGSLGALQLYAGLLVPDAVFLSHLHADHCVDLVAYSYARRFHPEQPGPISVHGPHGTRERLTAIGGGGRTAFDDVYDFATTRRGKTAMGPFEVTLAPAAHPVETYSIRLEAAGRTVVYSGDTGPSAALVANAKEADLLLCEATWDDQGDHPPDLHLTASQAGEHAQRGGVHRLWLVHTTPFTEAARLQEQAATAFTGDLEIPAAGTAVTL